MTVSIPHSMMLLAFLIRQGTFWKIIKLFARYHLSGYQKRPVSLERGLQSIRSNKNTPPEINIQKPIDIVIPVYNGYIYLANLFDSIFRNTDLSFRLIIVEDCSSDPLVLPFLQKIHADHPDSILLIQNRTNSGFAESVNIGVRHTSGHFVILNTDVEVPPNWLSRLMAPIFSGNRIASTTPFSNAADILSFPEFPGKNPIFAGLCLTELDEYFQYVKSGSPWIEVPSGVGFCMGVNRHAVEQIGMFDKETFGLGYCEENDWCMRAKKAGFKNIMVPNLFVYHKQGASFEDKQKKQLLRKNYWCLVKRHKEFLPTLYKFTAVDPLRPIREILVLIISATSGTSTKRINFFIGPKNNERCLKYQNKQYELVFTFDKLSTLQELFEHISTSEINLHFMQGFPEQAQIEKIAKAAFLEAGNEKDLNPAGFRAASE